MILERAETIDNRKVYPITLLWGVLEENRKIPVILDHKVQVVEAFLLFAMYKAAEYLSSHTPTTQNKGSYDSFINRIGYTLTSFAQYLRSKNIKWQEIDDFKIAEFKRYQNDVTSSKPNSLIPETINESVNNKLRVLYEFFWWAQHEQLLIRARIGHNVGAPITSNIARYKEDPSKFKKDKSAMKTVYPLCEYVTAEIGKHRRQHYATDEEISSLQRYFRQKCNVLTAERNVLIIDIIANVGWREGSVASLTTGQFSEDTIAKALKNLKNTIKVAPEHQKRGYNIQYDAFVQLAIRIKRYTYEVRQKMLERIGKVNDNAEPVFDNAKLFISYTTGQPLTAKAISIIISNGFKSIGVVGERAGPHSIRRKFGKDKSSEIHEVRKRCGLSTDTKDIVFDLSIALGQSSLSSQNSYNAFKRDIYNESLEAKQRGEISELKANETSLRLSLQRKEADILLLEKRVAELENKHKKKAL